MVSGLSMVILFGNQYLLCRLLRKMRVAGIQWFVLGTGVANILVSKYTRTLH